VASLPTISIAFVLRLGSLCIPGSAGVFSTSPPRRTPRFSAPKASPRERPRAIAVAAVRLSISLEHHRQLYAEQRLDPLLYEAPRPRRQAVQLLSALLAGEFEKGLGLADVHRYLQHERRSPRVPPNSTGACCFFNEGVCRLPFAPPIQTLCRRTSERF
jgi:hypothetical protein